MDTPATRGIPTARIEPHRDNAAVGATLGRKKPRRKPPHLTVPYEKPAGEPDGFRLPDPERSAKKGISWTRGLKLQVFQKGDK